jgi:hypothetical protein
MVMDVNEVRKTVPRTTDPGRYTLSVDERRTERDILLIPDVQTRWTGS